MESITLTGALHVPQDWEGRYAQFRVAVQTALDRGQVQSSYGDIVAQLASKERNVTSAKFAGRSKLAPKAAPSGENVSVDVPCMGAVSMVDGLPQVHTKASLCQPP